MKSRDTDGLWYLHGRSDDTIMVADKRCRPSEVESLFMATGQVTEAVATDIDDALKGETVACICVAKPGLKLMKPKLLPGFAGEVAVADRLSSLGKPGSIG